MKIIYSDQPIYEVAKHSVFLAGPTPRRSDVTSWRPAAIELLNKIEVLEEVYIPECSTGGMRVDYLDQVEWEYQALEACSIIMFWVPRDMATMPALTTNIEFGRYISLTPSRVLYGRPEWAVQTNYLDWMYRRAKNNKAPAQTLEGLVNDVREYLIQDEALNKFFGRIFS